MGGFFHELCCCGAQHRLKVMLFWLWVIGSLLPASRSHGWADASDSALSALHRHVFRAWRGICAPRCVPPSAQVLPERLTYPPTDRYLGLAAHHRRANQTTAPWLPRRAGHLVPDDADLLFAYSLLTIRIRFLRSLRSDRRSAPSLSISGVISHPL